VGYIRHRIEVAGGNPLLFEEDACRAVYRYSNGVPRLINLLCDTALVYGYAEQHECIGTTLVTDVAREKQQGGIFPTFHPAPPTGPTSSRSNFTAEDTGADTEAGAVHGEIHSKAEPSAELPEESDAHPNQYTPETARAGQDAGRKTVPDTQGGKKEPVNQSGSGSALHPRQDRPKKKDFA